MKFEKLKLDRHKQYAGSNLYIKNLSDSMDEDALKSEFEPFGTITSACVMRDENGRSRGFAFVCFSNPEEATKAVTEMNGKIIDNKPLYVAIAQRKEVRRQHLEAQYRAKMTQGLPPQMYPTGAPVFYPGPAGGMPQRPGFVYPQQMVPRRWPPQQAGPLMQRGPQQGGMVPPQIYGVPSMPPQGAVPSQQQARRGRTSGKQQAVGGGPRAGARKFPTGPNGAAPSMTMPPQMMQMMQPMQQPLTVQMLASAPVEQQKQIIGERLFPLIQAYQPALAGKITGMLLEMDNGELLNLLESHEALTLKIDEALQVLEAHQKSDEASAAESSVGPSDDTENPETGMNAGPSGSETIAASS